MTNNANLDVLEPVVCAKLVDSGFPAAPSGSEQGCVTLQLFDDLETPGRADSSCRHP